jgi:hypothetical protein
MRRNQLFLSGSAISFAAALLQGCGMPGPPQPPSLKLPKIVEDLDAQRSGGRVLLHWSGPRENTDKSKVEIGTAAVVCRRETPKGICDEVGTLPNRPGEPMSFTDALPADLLGGEARVISYEVMTENRRQKSAGWSAEVRVAAGPAAPDVNGLTAVNTAHGVALNWQTAGAAAGDDTIYRIFRTRLGDDKSAAKKNSAKPGLAQEEEPADQTLEVAANTRQAMDSHVAWGERYSYRVQAVKKVRLETERGLLRFELAGTISNTATVETKNVFPPEAPRGLAVVPVWGDDDKPGMDLNWEPNTEPTLAGYKIYRAVDSGSGYGAEELISGPTVLTAPAFADRGLTPGASYRYWLVAVDASGNTSPHSKSDTETAMRSRN